jgi:predicted HTH domain antitoxin
LGFGVTFIWFRIALFVAVSEVQTVTTRVPEEIFEDILNIEREEKAERAEVIRRLLADAIKRWKLKRALDGLRERKMSLRSAAKYAGLPYVEMLDEAEKAGITLDYSLRNLQLDLDAVRQKAP